MSKNLKSLYCAILKEGFKFLDYECGNYYYFIRIADDKRIKCFDFDKNGSNIAFYSFAR